MYLISKETRDMLDGWLDAIEDIANGHERSFLDCHTAKLFDQPIVYLLAEIIGPSEHDA